MTERKHKVKIETVDNVPAREKSSERSEIEAEAPSDSNADSEAGQPREIGGRQGPEPTRFGDWEKNGRCIDF